MKKLKWLFQYVQQIALPKTAAGRKTINPHYPSVMLQLFTSIKGTGKLFVFRFAEMRVPGKDAVITLNKSINIANKYIKTKYIRLFYVSTSKIMVFCFKKRRIQ